MTFLAAIGALAVVSFVMAAFAPLFKQRLDKAAMDVRMERIRQELLARHEAREKAAREAREAAEAAVKAEAEKASHDSVAYANDVLKEDP
jgi:Tfp pilus assembly protein FimT